MILTEARRLATEMFFAGTNLWCERFMRINSLCILTKIIILQEDGFSGSDDHFLGFHD
jgi:hypothetical protein